MFNKKLFFALVICLVLIIHKGVFGITPEEKNVLENLEEFARLKHSFNHVFAKEDNFATTQQVSKYALTQIQKEENENSIVFKSDFVRHTLWKTEKENLYFIESFALDTGLIEGFFGPFKFSGNKFIFVPSTENIISVLSSLIHSCSVDVIKLYVEGDFTFSEVQGFKYYKKENTPLFKEVAFVVDNKKPTYYLNISLILYDDMPLKTEKFLKALDTDKEVYEKQTRFIKSGKELILFFNNGCKLVAYSNPNDEILFIAPVKPSKTLTLGPFIETSKNLTLSHGY
ncbi:hypothetical protein A2310_02515 [candidate division WOR-1 bacterium RIFOXYB2_FULL_37_13]|uniref:Uncharacterized protein n=1 Tax=candidate division WOR-1 bacterium RIFOXYB2_FULL_37_13 TaxID=1802579 RepID=A0A1F4SE84_UNCSA|nr:MAG: hypothetical protein A2310_02515 [candidate division WOR-1 bacterium RIFOXYB2_FULL_37_13]